MLYSVFMLYHLIVTEVSESKGFQHLIICLVSCLLHSFFFFLGLRPWHMEFPRLGGLIGATAAGLHHSHSNSRSKPCLRPTPAHGNAKTLRINPLSKARDWTRNLMVSSQIHFRCATTGTPFFLSFFKFFKIIIRKKIKLQSIYNILSISSVLQSDPVTHIHTFFFSHVCCWLNPNFFFLSF